MKHSGDDTNAIQNKAVRLFTYLEKALALDDSISRDFRTNLSDPSPWWLADLPTDLDNLQVRSFDSLGSESDLPWLRVEKRNLKESPKLPRELEEWVEEVNPLEAPKGKESVGRKIDFNKDSERVREFKKFRKNYEEGMDVPEILNDWVICTPEKLPEAIKERYFEDSWSDHPELQKLLDGYIKNDWNEWAEKTRKEYRANLLYDQLYALRLVLKNEGDNYELLLGHGFLTWQHKAVGAIYAPVFLTPLTLDFDAAKRSIELSPDALFRSFVDISSLYDIDSPAEMDLTTWADKINSAPFDFWQLEALKLQAKTLINYLSTDSEDVFTDEVVSVPEITKVPGVWNAPVIFARKRTNDFWSKYAAKIRIDLESKDVQTTDFIKDLVGDYSTSESQTSISGIEEHTKSETLAESELYFPLPWNEEQKRIAERLNTNYGVVVKGPPGTGKSHTIANLISRFLAEGKSVLVTSQTGKALEVLRDKLPENIRSLAVSQLSQSAKQDDVLQQSITEISSNLGERHTKFSDDEREAAENKLNRIRLRKSEVADEIRTYVLTDSTAFLLVDGKEIKPLEAGKFVAEQKISSDISWFIDSVESEQVLNFTEQDLQDLHRLFTDLGKEEIDLHKYTLPNPDLLPNSDVVAGAFATYRQLGTLAKANSSTFDAGKYKYSEEELSEIWNLLTDANKVLNSLTTEYEEEIFSRCSVSQTENEKWSSVSTKLEMILEKISKCKSINLGHDVSGNMNLSPRETANAINALRAKMGSGKLGNFSKLMLSPDAKKILEIYKIDGDLPDTIARLDILEANLNLSLYQKELYLLLEQAFSDLALKEFLHIQALNIIQVEVIHGQIKRIVDYKTQFATLGEFINKTREFSGLSMFAEKDLAIITHTIGAEVAKFKLSSLDQEFKNWIEEIQQLVSGQKHKAVKDLCESIEKKNTTGWNTAVAHLQLAVDNQSKSSQLYELSKKIKKTAPNLFKDILELADSKDKFVCPNNLELAWKVARLDTWLGELHGEDDIDALQEELERLTKREQELNSQLISILAWQRQIDKVSKSERDALMAWSDAMKKYGKGSGKYSYKWLHAAQESLQVAKNAVPVWIMPLNRVAQMFSQPEAGMFDVVIFDEASQCDIKGITVAYLGKQLLVVGDPEQISPAGVFQNQEKIFDLISRFLFDFPLKDSFSITSSLFDLAKIRLSNIIQLNEHFRCVPEIIAFNNYHIYEMKLQVLRYPQPKNLLKPALVPVLIEGGYQNKNNKVNEPEAQAIVEKLVECLENPLYQMRPNADGSGEHLCTFGIISLLANDQAKHIKGLLMRHPKIGEKVIEERKLLCGDAYTFQGDERDVIFLSMVKAYDPDKIRKVFGKEMLAGDYIEPLVKEESKRIFNVAVSRARDQIFLFHSIRLETLSNPNDWRLKLLKWFYEPRTEELNAGREALKREYDSGRASAFSYDVGNLIIEKGYQVIPEYPVIGYRIDLVIQGSNARLAVECDGDQYHTLENWDADQNRERQLRRAGWEFWRLTGSSFYRNKENALESLWEKLKEMKIEPVHER
jgi:superfamily I DNA and/or RNA helicase/very-short-patch-repair endonuclease